MDRFGELAAPNSAFPRATRLGWCAPRSGPGVGFGYTAMASISRQVTDTWRSSRAGSADLGAVPKVVAGNRLGA
jgi:hypothetical protein